MYKLKEKPEDFIVEEQISPELDENGDYAYFWLRKRCYTTVRAIENICRFLRCRMRDVGFAGNKDKQAVTRQAVSVKDPGKSIGEARFERFNSDDLSLEYIGRGKKPISLGDLSGNAFAIVVRECDKAPVAVSQFVNYFDEQRFSETNRDVGKAIVKGDFKRACELIVADDIGRHLAESPNDFVGAMKNLPLKVRMLHVHAYQSWLWNSVVNEYLQCKYDCVKVQYSLGELSFPNISIPIVSVPIVGFGTELKDDKIGKMTKELMTKEKLSVRDFVIKSMPELSAEGGVRDAAVEVNDCSVDKIGEQEYRIRFMLPKGSYATMAVKRMLA